MYARVARWEGGDAEAMRRSAAGIREQAASGPPEGLPSTGLTVLIDPENGTAMGISFFETLEDLRQGDKVLREMNPPDDAMGKRVAVDVYEVGVDIRTGVRA